MRRGIWIAVILAVLVVLGMQYHRPKLDLPPVNPTATFEAQLHPSSQVHQVLQKSCYDCHSAQGNLPWYRNVWPASALMERDIRLARVHMDLSNWNNLGEEMSHIRLARACQEMREARMPLWYYRPLHPGSAPRQDEVEAFCAWVNSSPLHSGVAELR